MRPTRSHSQNNPFPFPAAQPPPAQTGRIEHLYQDRHTTKVRLYLEYGDLSDSSNLCELLSRIRPHELYNLAAQSHVKVRRAHHTPPPPPVCPPCTMPTHCSTTTFTTTTPFSLLPSQPLMNPRRRAGLL